jgi:hypothetical protein
MERCPEQKGACRFYSYLTKIKSELVKVTVAAKSYYKQWHCKQVAAHGVKSNKCYVKDMEYNGMGHGYLASPTRIRFAHLYRVGWHAEKASKYERWWEDGCWYDAECKYYNPSYAITVNLDYIEKFPEYKYSAYKHFNGDCIIKYLKLYKQYPQTEYLLKLELSGLYNSIMVLKLIGKDKNFCKWLVTHKDEIVKNYYYVDSIIRSYKTGKPIRQIQTVEQEKKQISNNKDLQPIRELFRKDMERFILYLEKQKVNAHTYLDYLNACNYLGLDMKIPKNRYPHDFNRWHDIRIDEYHTAKIKADQKERADFYLGYARHSANALYKQFAAVAERYLALQNCKNGIYAVFIARSPADLIHEGKALNHCVGRMNYDQKMIREETLIFFIRSVEQPDIPFVTIEYSPKSKRILQCYGNRNTRPDDTVLTFINKVWLPYANRTVKKLNTQVA